MDLNVTSMVCLVVGLTLMYAAKKNMYPQDIVRQVMGKQPVHGPIVGQWHTGKALPAATTPIATTPSGPLNYTPGQVIATV